MDSVMPAYTALIFYPDFLHCFKEVTIINIFHCIDFLSRLSTLFRRKKALRGCPKLGDLKI